MNRPSKEYLEKYAGEEARIGLILEEIYGLHLYKDIPTSDIDFFVLNDAGDMKALCEVKCRSRGEENHPSTKYKEWIIPKRKFEYIKKCYKTYPKEFEFWIVVEWADGLFRATFKKGDPFEFEETDIKRADRNKAVPHLLIPSKLFKKIKPNSDFKKRSGAGMEWIEP